MCAHVFFVMQAASVTLDLAPFVPSFQNTLSLAVVALTYTSARTYSSTPVDQRVTM